KIYSDRDRTVILIPWVSGPGEYHRTAGVIARRIRVRRSQRVVQLGHETSRDSLGHYVIHVVAGARAQAPIRFGVPPVEDFHYAFRQPGGVRVRRGLPSRINVLESQPRPMAVCIAFFFVECAEEESRCGWNRFGRPRHISLELIS